MAKVTVTEAAKLAGMARQHLYRAYINTGKISIDRGINGRPMVDTSELIRVFGELKMSHGNDGSGQSETIERDGKNSMLQRDSATVDEVVALLRTQLEEARARERDLIEKAEAREAWLRQQLERAQAVLTDQSAKDKRRWWQFWG